MQPSLAVFAFWYLVPMATLRPKPGYACVSCGNEYNLVIVEDYEGSSQVECRNCSHLQSVCGFPLRSGQGCTIMPAPGMKVCSAHAGLIAQKDGEKSDRKYPVLGSEGGSSIVVRAREMMDNPLVLGNLESIALMSSILSEMASSLGDVQPAWKELQDIVRAAEFEGRESVDIGQISHLAEIGADYIERVATIRQVVMDLSRLRRDHAAVITTLDGVMTSEEAVSLAKRILSVVLSNVVDSEARAKISQAVGRLLE